MPTYEYRCNACGYEFERFQKITADPVSVCPRCEGPVERLIPKGSGFIIKGPGSYVNNSAPGNGVSRCGRESPCCGRDTPCATKPCDK